MNYCLMRYYLKYVQHEKELELPAFKKGSCLHELVEHFWNRLGDKYNNAEGFGKYGRGKFYQKIIMFESSGKKVDWTFKEQKHTMAESVKKVCVSLFDILLNEGPPLYTEIPFEFVAFRRRFIGKIDEIRIKNGELIIRDYKSGKSWMGYMKLHHDPQMTMYNVGLNSLCYHDENFAKSVNLPSKKEKNKSFVNDKIIHEFFMLEAQHVKELAKENKKIKTIPELINRTSRTDDHFYEVIKMIQGGEKRVIEGNIYPERGRKCDDCSMKLACEKKVVHAKKNISEDESGQGIFSFAAPLFMKPVDKKVKQARLFKPSRKYKVINN